MKYVKIVENNKNTFLNSWQKYLLLVSIVLFIFISFLALLDYHTFRYIFHFDVSAFLDIYFYSSGLNTQLLTYVFIFPFFILLLFFLIPFLSSWLFIDNQLFPYKKTNKYSKKVMVIVSLLSHILFSITAIISWSYYFHRKEGALIYLILIAILIIVLSTLFTIGILRKLFKINLKEIVIKYPFYLLVLNSLSLLLSLPLITYLISINYLDMAIIPFFIFTWGLYIFTYIFILVEHRSTKTKNNKPIFRIVALILLIILVLIKYCDNKNQDLWKDTKVEMLNFSCNLFTNKFFLSNNHIKLDINTSNYINTDINNSCTKKLDNILHINKVTYFPISTQVKLYFKKENNITCVYAIDKNYKLLDIGYINP